VKQCAVCGSANVRRSRVHPSEAETHPFRSPYRCHDCDARFWVVSRRARVGAVAGGAAVLALLILVGSQMALHSFIPRSDSPRPSSVAASNRDALDAVDRRALDDIIKLQSDVVDKELQQPSRR